MANDQLVAQIAGMGTVGIVLLLLLLAVLLVPMFLVMFSKRVSGGRKLFWVLMMGTFSWLAWPPYLLALRKSEKTDAAAGGKS